MIPDLEGIEGVDQKGVRFLDSDLDFIRLIPLIVELSHTTSTPFYQNIGEVCGVFNSDNTIVIYLENSGLIEGYICGYFMGHDTFYIAQAVSHSPEVGDTLDKVITNIVNMKGVDKILFLTPHEPRVFQKYGYKLERHLLVKYINGNNENKEKEVK